jgi:hypothetical protein
MTARGVAGGSQLGCDYQLGPFVFGLQGLLDLSEMKGSDVLPTTMSQKIHSVMFGVNFHFVGGGT